MSDPHDQLHLHGIDPLQGKTLIVRKRDGRHEEFNEARVFLAIESAFKALEGLTRDTPLPEALQSAVRRCADAVVEKVLGRAVRGEQMEVEHIQDAVEDRLMLEGHLAVARCYILFREKRRLARAEREGRFSSPAPIAIRPPDPLPPLPAPVPEVSLLERIYRQALPQTAEGKELEDLHRDYFSKFLHEGHYLNILAPALLEFDLEKLAAALRLERDALFPPAGLHALYEDFLLRDEGRCIETPQYFWMRIAMGLAINDAEQTTARALEFYGALSTFRFIPSEAVLHGAGRVNPTLIASYKATSWGDLEHITAQPPKPGSTCSWLEPWHSGILDFLVRPQPGAPPWDHDLNKALWIPDLFIKRIRQQGRWTLFDPAEAPDLHQLHGRAFDERYLEYERKAQRGQMPGSRHLKATDLWQEIMASLAQTGQPWIGFKDAASVRSPCDEETVRSGGLCTSILLNTPAHEAAACSPGAINVAAHLTDSPNHPLDIALLRRTISAAMRMLDNALDLNCDQSESARTFCEGQRPAALGITGFQDALDRLGLSYESAAAADFADRSMESISYYALLSSVALAKERGAFPKFTESKWSRGQLPLDTLALLNGERGVALDLPLSHTQDWEALRESIRRDGLRHCTVTSISTERVSARLTGVSPSTEPAAHTLPDPRCLVECAARRQKWTDMGHALNLYAPTDDLSALSNLYLTAWEKGLKTIRQLSRKKEKSAPTNPASHSPAVSKTEFAVVS
jgi:ribonucleoside-diphosphate reductase alpha chain